MSRLFSPITLRNTEIPNRLWMPPMCMYSAPNSGPEMGHPQDFHIIHYGACAKGGAGLIIVEATAVCPEGRITPWDLLLSADGAIPAFQRLTAAIKAGGAVPAVQLQHAGRKASGNKGYEGGALLPVDQGGWQPKGASPIAFSEAWAQPEEMTKAEIQQVVANFAAATRRALAAGFEVIEIHGAHGYLISSFCSPLSNQRTDEYGGNFDNRVRLALEVSEAVREAAGDAPVIFRLSATEWIEENPADNRESWTVADTIALSQRLAQVGIDFIDASSGGNVPNVPIAGGPGYQVALSDAVRTLAPLPVSAVGRIMSATQAEQILITESADAVEVGRPLLFDPFLPRKWREELGDDPQWPVQYGYTKKRLP